MSGPSGILKPHH